MIEIFSMGIQHYFAHIALIVMIAITMEFYTSGSYKQDTILLCSNIITTLCIALYIASAGDLAIIFSTLSYIALNIYSQFFRRKKYV